MPGEYACYGAFSGGEILAYAFFVLLREGGHDRALLDYLAVQEQMRDRGVGSAFLQMLMSDLLQGMQCALLEVDDPDYAASPEERDRWNRRLHFYLRNGLRDTRMRSAIYGAHFRVLAMPVGQPLQADEMKTAYEGLYHSMLPRKIYEQRVKIMPTVEE